MNRARIKLLISDLKAAERDVLHGSTNDADRELLQELKTALDDSRLTIWCATVHASSGSERAAHIQSVRMTRVVEMLRQIDLQKRRSQAHRETPVSFNELMRIAEQAINQVQSKPN